jgi:hypothetical protein
MSCAGRRDAILLFAAGALEPYEQAELEAHLATGCPFCAGERAAADATLAHLAFALDPVEPPAGVRARLLAALDQMQPTRGAASGAAPPRRARRGRALAGAAVAGAVLAFAAAQFTGQRALERQVAELEAAVAANAQALDVLRAAKLRTVALKGPAAVAPGTFKIYWDWKKGGCYVYASDMPQPPPGRVYQLWFSNVDGEPIPGGILNVKPSGEATLVTEMPRDIDLFGEVKITLEEDPRDAVPSSSLVLSGHLDEQ